MENLVNILGAIFRFVGIMKVRKYMKDYNKSTLWRTAKVIES